MKCALLCVVFFVTVSLSVEAVKIHPLSDEFIALINNKQSTWKAGRNFAIETPLSQIKKLLGVLPKTETTRKLPIKVHPEGRLAVPEFFDAREQWPECASVIGNIRDQSACGSCWAVGAVEVMSDRICIKSNGTIKVSISAEDLMTCCVTCAGCNGGSPPEAWNYWEETGIVTGGGYQSHEGCKTYALQPCEHHVAGARPACGDFLATPSCTRACDSDSPLVFEDDLTFGSAYGLWLDVTQIQTEILTNGPVEADYVVYEDFLVYKSGVYQHVEGEYAGGHAIKILGWGVEEDTPYWLVANSWNSDWGDNGYFKILRGTNECGIEGDIAAGIPKL